MYNEDEGGETKRLLDIVKSESDDEFWSEIDELVNYFMIDPLSQGGNSTVNDVKWFTGQFIDEYVKRATQTNSNTLLREQIYYILKVLLYCDRYLGDDKETIKQFETLFTEINVSMTKFLQVIIDYWEADLISINKFNKKNLLKWVEQNEDVFT